MYRGGIFNRGEKWGNKREERDIWHNSTKIKPCRELIREMLGKRNVKTRNNGRGT